MIFHSFSMVKGSYRENFSVGNAMQGRKKKKKKYSKHNLHVDHVGRNSLISSQLQSDKKKNSSNKEENPHADKNIQGIS